MLKFFFSGEQLCGLLSLSLCGDRGRWRSFPWGLPCLP